MCAQCHSVEKFGDSPLAIAPPFRTLHERYSVDVLPQKFTLGIVTAHPTMPQFMFDAGRHRT